MIRRCMRSITYPFANRTRWNEVPFVNIESLSCSQSTITIRLPQGTYTRVGTYPDNSLRNVVVDATFSVKQTIEGTPLQVISRLSSSALQAGELYKYVEGNNIWFLGREVCILNNVVAYLMLPTVPRVLLISTNLMVCASRMSKVLKERIVPDLVDNFGQNITVKIVDTRGFVIARGERPEKIVSKDSIRDVLLEHIDEIV